MKKILTIIFILMIVVLIFLNPTPSDFKKMMRTEINNASSQYTDLNMNDIEFQTKRSNFLVLSVYEAVFDDNTSDSKIKFVGILKLFIPIAQ